MELGRSAWIRRERLERIANAERDRRAGRTALAIAALGEASEWPARAVLALALLPSSEGSRARQLLEEGLDVWALESGLTPLDELDELEEGMGPAEEPFEPPSAPSAPSYEAFQIELGRPIEAGELERAFAEAEAQVDEMHDVNQVAERVLFDRAFELADLAGEELDPLEESARLATSRQIEATAARTTDAASVPPRVSAQWDVDTQVGRPSPEIVLATLERWLQNLEHSRAGGMQS